MVNRLEGAFIEVLGARIIDGRRELMPVPRKRSHRRGRKLPHGRFAGPPSTTARSRPLMFPGASWVHSPRPGRRRIQQWFIFLPRATLVPPHLSISVAGQHAQAQFSLKLGPAFKLAGAVSGLSAYKQIESPMITDQSERPLLAPTRWDSQAGTFEFFAVPALEHTRFVSMPLMRRTANHGSGRRLRLIATSPISGWRYSRCWRFRWLCEPSLPCLRAPHNVSCTSAPMARPRIASPFPQWFT